MRLVLVKTGDAAPAVAERHGDYDRMFLEQIEDLPVEVRVVHAHHDEALPPIAETDAMMMTGSPASVTEREPWAERLAEWTNQLVDADRPVLGVCYGHQLLAYARGGVVELNPRGYEIGTIEVRLTDAGRSDPLLSSVAAPFLFNSLHSDAVTRLPKEATVLAVTDQTDVQAYAIGDRVWGVQFHPEISEAAMRMYVDQREDRVRADAQGRVGDVDAYVDQIRANVRATPAGRALIRRFVELAQEIVG